MQLPSYANYLEVESDLSPQFRFQLQVQTSSDRAWVHRQPPQVQHFVLALERQRQVDPYGFEASLSYTESSGTALAILRDPVSRQEVVWRKGKGGGKGREGQGMGEREHTYATRL